MHVFFTTFFLLRIEIGAVAELFVLLQLLLMVDDTRLELADAAAGGKHPQRSGRALPGLE